MADDSETFKHFFAAGECAGLLRDIMNAVGISVIGGRDIDRNISI